MHNKLSLAVFAVALTVAGLAQADTAQAEDKFAAIAYSTQTGAWGYSYGYDTQERAEQMAKHYAEDATAETRAWVRNGYIALAVGDNVKHFGWGWATTPARAREIALMEASKRTTGCYVVVCVHTTDGKID